MRIAIDLYKNLFDGRWMKTFSYPSNRIYTL